VNAFVVIVLPDVTLSPRPAVAMTQPFMRELLTLFQLIANW
jgi:hypothetical protein